MRCTRWLLLCLALLPIGARLAQPNSITLDGLRDPAYVLLAVDPAADLAGGFASDPKYSWAELSALYVTTDTTNLYVYVDLPYFSSSAATGEIGLVIDTTGDVPNSGGATDPWFNAVTFAYAVTHANTGTVPLNTSHIVLPEVVIRGNVPGVTFQDDGHTELMQRNGSAWRGDGPNWGGIQAFLLVGTHVAYANGQGVEFSIPYADLGVPPQTPLNLQFFTTAHVVLQTPGAFDTVPSDNQAAVISHTTTLHRLASLLPAPPPLPCASAALGDSAAVTAGLAHDSTSAQDHNPPGAVLPGASVAFRLRACAGDLGAVHLLVWDTDDPSSAAPTHTYALTPTVAGDYAYWIGSATAPVVAADHWYQFRLTDGGPAGYARPAAGETGPANGAVALGAPAWHWPTLTSAALFLPLLTRP